MTSKKPSVLERALYFALLTIMYYFNTTYIDIGFHLMIKVLMSMTVIAIAFLRFLVYPDFLRIKKLTRASFIIILPNLLIAFWSLFSWAVSFTSMSNITRGLSSQVYQIFAVLAMAGVLSALGEQGIWLNLGAMLTANLIYVLQVVRTSGPVAYFAELWETIRSFAATTGELMLGTEVHELTFAIGLYMLYFLLFPKQIKKHWILALITLFCMLTGFKRIGVMALVTGVAFGWILFALQKKWKKFPRFLTVFGVSIVVLSFVYIVLIRQGLFVVITEQLGIDTLGRRDLYEAVHPYYSLSPLFMGQGTGFVSQMFTDTESTYFASIGALHNDFLQIYVDIGFTGFWLWGISMLPVKTALLSRNNMCKVLCFSLTLYCYVTYATDNTYYYLYVNAAAATLMLGAILTNEDNEESIQEIRGQDDG